MRWLAAAALIGCGTDPARNCQLDQTVADWVGSAAVVDCGNLYNDGTSGIDTAAWQAAQTCVLDHAGQQQPFVARWMRQGIEGPIAGAYVGVVRDGGWTLAAFDQSAQITGAVPPTTRYACTDLQAAPQCSSLDTNLCIDCFGRTTAEHCMP